MAYSQPVRSPFNPEVNKMAEGGDKDGHLPQKGNVEKVCKEWLVHEDGAMAYKLQNEENNMHYGLNRFQRRTVRGDIPVAKLVQSEEEKRQQEERLRELESLREQAEKDARIAKEVQEQEKQKAWQKNTTELDDEEIARLMQEKEKKKYERYLEKKKEKELKKKRERLERELAAKSEHAGMSQSRLSDDQGSERLNGSTDRLSLEDGGSSINGHITYSQRVTPAGQLEDDGDFSDFYALPPGNDDDPVRRHMQESQDEELARLLQEQEHKRTKAEVDKSKLKAIELQDEELAKVIHEQEKLKIRKAKQKRQQKLQQQQSTENVRRLSTERPLPNPESPPDQQPPYQHLYRRDSYTRSISNNNSAPVQDSPTAQNYEASHHLSDDEQWYNLPDDVDITSARELSDQRSSSRPQQDKNSHRFVSRGQNGVSQRSPPQSRQQHQQQQPPRHNTGRSQINDQLPPAEVPSVERWLAESVPNRAPTRQTSAVLPPSPSPPGSYHSEEDSPESLGHVHQTRLNHTSRSHGGGQSFNIAAAIDPTYKRRQHEFEESPGEQNQQTHQKSLAFSRSLPIEVEELEWDPAGLRGSLRRPKGQFNPAANYPEQNTLSSLRSELEALEDGGPVMNQWQPVQGQRRSTLENRRKLGKPQGGGAGGGKGGKGGSCKQQ